MDEIIKEFLVESYENLDRLDQALVELEKDPQHKESLNSIFRTIHTIKGTCGFLGFGKLQRVTHVGETLLSRLRDGKLLLNEEITTGLLAMVDAVRKMLSIIESTGREGSEEYPDLVERLTLLADGKSGVPAGPANPPAETSGTPAAPPMPAMASEPTASPGPRLAPQASHAPTTPQPAPPRSASPSSSPALPETPANHKAPETHAPEKVEVRAGGMSESTIRVDVGLLDKLMNLVGELVLARNEILELTNARTDPLSLRTGQRLNLITTELQESVMKTRMQPIENVWGKFPRLVRDVAAELGKRVRLEMSGHETELDRSVIEAIKDPLTHIIRNSIDHGIETPAKRVAAGKPEEGLLRMRAFHEGGQVNIEIADDGAGIDTERVKQKAVQQGLISSEQAALMTEHEAISLIFRPGFSTAEKVTNVSGRGVGMDVVKSNIKKIGGSVDISTEKSKGTTLKIKIPLTLAIIPALVVTADRERFAIPQVSLLELLRLEGEQAERGLEQVFGAPVYRLRGKLLPLVFLWQVLKMRDNGQAELREQPGRTDTVVNIVVLQADGQPFGLVVDEVNDTQEIVVKPLGKHLKGIPVFAGATIMGDGRLALILDVLGLAQTAGVITQARNLRLLQQSKQAQGVSAETRQSLLVFTVGREHRMALPLPSVWRLEKFPRASIEREGPQEVVQYRGQIMPLLRLSTLCGGEAVDAPRDSDLQVVIYSEHGRSVGLVVGQVVDIVEQAVQVEKRTGRAGVMGAAVIQGRVTELLDAPAVLRELNSQFAAAD